ncbi:MAG: 2-oxoglutarate dehydrogenase E1 component [Bacteroidetes bacterium GWF2_38_335]|nr:MAG: 2-oxoglutarate dehydrogenase E1 component [Bacteroidetes bacterium GWF2_38_335]OFY77729.1 MAG: 2-oxoglutarate dehydrogenase E1 component [Bacteroidetes bacterium RIFOXYA12_FULL_38_20]HBS89082.1 2-oxoglutarate dehydrogenase E1 component [Bacteroidales bacterium]
MENLSFLGNIDNERIDEMYNQFLADPQSVDESWRNFFRGFEFARSNFETEPSGLIDKEFKVKNLIDSYRKRGHLFTETNPVRVRRKYTPTLDIENFGLQKSDLATVFQAGKDIGIGPAKLSDIIDFLKTTYCKSIGIEYMFIRTPEVTDWIRNRLESCRNKTDFSASEKIHFLDHLKMAVGFEKFIHKKFTGQKRFSLEGGEALIPALDMVIEKGSELGVDEFVIGMAHRGRLNVITNILKKPYENIFKEYTGKNYDESNILGDVKYHLGYNNTIKTDNGKLVKLNLVPNPSHLETVGPVVQGISKAKILRKHSGDYNKLIPVIIHGDAAVASQGVVYEVVQMSQLPGYKTGGTVHLVINNQVGFTTNYLEGRSSTYCTDIAKVIKAPIFHVNGDDVEALVHTVKIAIEYRQQFHTDVFIDILCYRKYGHNEGDEPRFTQPLLYKEIEKHPNPFEIYAGKLISEKAITPEKVRAMQQEFDDLLESNLGESKKSDTVHIEHFLEEDWGDFKQPGALDFKSSPETGVDMNILLKLASALTTLPDNKIFFKKVVKLVDDRRQMIAEGKIDWALGELLAYGSLVNEGIPVRVSGQDSERGTFSHRHAAHVIDNTDEKYYPLKNINPDQAPFDIYNSPLSEYGVLGFEYGYALGRPEGLAIWEAQFGDFHNVAQVIIDQYISSAGEKWGLMNGLTLLLPHGFEGQGPEHSSARMERFLELCANNNMQIVNCTTPANFFHVLRRQLKRNFERPLIVFTPKSLLRHPECISDLKEIATGHFSEVIDDLVENPDSIMQVVFCTGKIYYDLIKEKRELKADTFAVVRIEQLYPTPLNQIKDITQKYKNATRFVWVQEEPGNMGAWPFIARLPIENQLELVSRPPSGSPATGLAEIHQLQHKKILSKVFRKCTCDRSQQFCGLQCTIDHEKELRRKRNSQKQ